MQLTCPSCGNAYADDQAEGLCPRCLAAMAVRMSDTPVDEVPVEPGESFHGLRVLKLVARGGMGIIYRARQPVSNRDVALKILPRSLAAEEEFRLRFDREARALAGLNHPNIVNLYDYGIEGDLMFLVMEFVEGASLRHPLREKRISPDRALKIALDLCEALEFAHKEGIIHRDIKPENVLIDRSGRVKLTDFGLAKRVDPESTQLTQTNLAVGTPHYMAPEQLEQPKSIDHRVDIYSMGVLLYEMLTRELPIGRFPAPSGKEGVDERLDDIVYRCLDKDPDRRYASITQLKNALKSVTGKSYEAPIAGLPDERPTPARAGGSNNSVTCACGWQFFVPAAARGTVHCPTCGEPVSIGAPTPAPGRPPTTRAQAPLRSRIPAPRKLLIAAGLLTGLVVLFLILVLGPGSSGKDPDISYTAPRKTPPPDSEPAITLLKDSPKVKAPDKPKTAAENPAPKPSAAASELRRQIDSLSAQANLAGIVSTILLYSGRPLDHEALHARLGQFDGGIKDLVLQLEEMGLHQDPPEHFLSGDRMSAFAGRRIEPARTIAFADELRSWLRAFRPGVSENVTVMRERRPVSFALQFPERLPELVAIAHQAGVVLGETPGYVPPTPEPQPSPAAAIPVSILNDLKARLSALPAFYRDSLPYEDRGRGEALLLAGQGTGEDTIFLNGRFSDLIRRCEAERQALAAKVRELETRIADPNATTDIVACKDGRRLEGSIIEETPAFIKMKVRLGTVTVTHEEILKIEKGKGSASEFRSAYESGRGKKTELLNLLAMAKDRKLPLHQELAAAAILAIDPGDERCRTELGLGRTPFAAGPENDSAAVGDRIEYRGRLYTPEQLRAELRSVGYVQVNGLWCEKVAKSFKIDNLYADQGKLPATYSGVSVLSQSHTEKGTVYDYKTRSWIPTTKQVGVARYIGGSGTCMIEIVAPGDFIDCRVHARSQVARVGGFVSVSAVVDYKEPGKLLYTLSAPGENDGSHDVTDKVAGRSRFYIRADVRGDGMFLISDSNDMTVLEVKYNYGRPLDKINALFSVKPPTSETAPELKSNNDSIETACRNHASQIVQIPSLADALSEMRKGTEGMLYAREFVMPSRFTDVAAQIKDPLLPDWNGMTRDQVLKLGAWWGAQGLEERRDFLTAYGLWCARARSLRGR